MAPGPLVSVILATHNEAAHIRPCLDSLLSQDCTDFALEILAIDGLSDDGTREIIEQTAALDSRVRLLQNQKKSAPFAFNLGLREAKGEFVCVFGSHTVYRNDYIAICLRELTATGAVGCGGRVVTEPFADSLQARLVASALAHPFGSSRKSFRTQAEGFADTVNYMVMRKDPLIEVGGYLEELTRNQDNDTNQKLRAMGYKLFCTWKTQCIYHPKETIRDLFVYAYRCGFWNVISFKKNPGSMAVRHFLPSIFVAGLLSAFLLAVFGMFSPSPYRVLLILPFLFVFLLHLGAGTLAALQVAIRQKQFSALFLPFVFLGFHFAYGFGTLSAIVQAAETPRPISATRPGPSPS